MLVRLRQISEQLRNGLSTIPLLFASGAVLLAFLVLQVDSSWGVDNYPAFLQTTTDNATSILTSVAGGLISAVTLLLSLALVAVQLGSSQFSPRTLSNWLGDRVLQVSIGLVLGTIIYCLVVLQALGNFQVTEADGPHRAATVAVLLTIVSLIAVVRSVDHLAKSLRIGAVAQTIQQETLSLIDRTSLLAMSSAPAVPTTVAVDGSTGHVIEATQSGWVQQIDSDALFESCQAGDEIEVLVQVGAFVVNGSPIAVRTPPRYSSTNTSDQVVAAFALGPSRTMQEDVGFGLLRLSDIAIRALSPGVNDPNTAIDVLNYIETILMELMAVPEQAGVVRRDGRVLRIPRPTHEQYVQEALSGIRFAASASPTVVLRLAVLCRRIIQEIARRDLPARPEIFRTTVEELRDQLDGSTLLEVDVAPSRIELDAAVESLTSLSTSRADQSSASRLDP